MSKTKKAIKLTEEHKRNISESRRGMKFTQAHKQNMRRAKARGSNLIIRTPHGDYQGFNEAGRKTGISYKTIFNRCNNPKPKWTGWQVIRKEPEEIEKNQEEWRGNKHKAALQKNLESMSKSLQEFGETRIKEGREWRLQRSNQTAKTD